MQGDSTLPPDQRRNYTSIFDACRRIPREDGIRGLWKGGVPTVARATASTCGMFTSYETVKENLVRLMPNNIGLAWFLSSFIAGSVAALVSLPFDNAKTKMQKMKADANGKMPYKNIFDAIIKTARVNGITGLWVGLPTYTVRIASHIVITFNVSERIKKFLNS